MQCKNLTVSCLSVYSGYKWKYILRNVFLEIWYISKGVYSRHCKNSLEMYSKEYGIENTKEYHRKSEYSLASGITSGLLSLLWSDIQCIQNPGCGHPSPPRVFGPYPLYPTAPVLMYSSKLYNVIRTSKRQLETPIPWLGDWLSGLREFLQRAFKPL